MRQFAPKHVLSNLRSPTSTDLKPMSSASKGAGRISKKLQSTGNDPPSGAQRHHRPTYGCSRTRQPHRFHGFLEPQDSQHSHEIEGKYVQTHLGTHVGQPACQEVCVAHPVLERPEAMLDGPPAHCHRVRRLAEPTLDCFQHRLMLPSS